MYPRLINTFYILLQYYKLIIIVLVLKAFFKFIHVHLLGFD